MALETETTTTERKKTDSPYIDRLTFKTTSARFLMATLTTMSTSLLMGFICYKYPDSPLTQTLVSQYFTVWGVIVAFYFARPVDKDKS